MPTRSIRSFAICLAILALISTSIVRAEDPPPAEHLPPPQAVGVWVVDMERVFEDIRANPALADDPSTSLATFVVSWNIDVRADGLIRAIQAGCLELRTEFIPEDDRFRLSAEDQDVQDRDYRLLVRFPDDDHGEATLTSPEGSYTVPFVRLFARPETPPGSDATMPKALVGTWRIDPEAITDLPHWDIMPEQYRDTVRRQWEGRGVLEVPTGNRKEDARYAFMAVEERFAAFEIIRDKQVTMCTLRLDEQGRLWEQSGAEIYAFRRIEEAP